MLVRLRKKGWFKCRFGSGTLPILWAGASGQGGQGTFSAFSQSWNCALLCGLGSSRVCVVEKPTIRGGACSFGSEKKGWFKCRFGSGTPDTMGWGEWARGSRNLFGVFPVLELCSAVWSGWREKKCRFGSGTLPKLWAGASGQGGRGTFSAFSQYWNCALLCGLGSSRVNSEPVGVVEKPTIRGGACSFGSEKRGGSNADSAPGPSRNCGLGRVGPGVKEPFRRVPRLSNADSAPAPSRYYGLGRLGKGVQEPFRHFARCWSVFLSALM